MLTGANIMHITYLRTMHNMPDSIDPYEFFAPYCGNVEKEGERSYRLDGVYPETKKEKTEQKQPEQQQPLKKKISVRCSECKNVFTVEKGEFETKIECPHCGRKGVIKQ
jgi:DNA-directed RNA polymerase subunit RPC12/RpoP